jgi:MFS family permease
LRQLIFLSVAAHAALAGARVSTSLYALSQQASTLTIGILLALFSLIPMLFALKVGRVIDRIGLRRPVTIGCALIAFGCLLPVLLPGIKTLYVAVVAIGSGFMAVQIGSQHTVGAISAEASRAGNYGWLALAYSVSSFSGPVIAGYVIEHAGHRMAYLVFFGCAVAALVAIAAGGLQRMPAPAPDTGTPRSAMDLLRQPALLHIYAAGILLSAAWDLFIFIMPIHVTRLGFSASTVGLVLGCFSAATFTVRLAMPWIVRRHGQWRILGSALALAALCYFLFPFAGRLAGLMTVAALLGLAVGSSQSNILTLLHDAAPAGRAAEAIAIRSTVGNASQVILPIVFGAAGTALGLFAVFWSVGAIIALGVPLAYRRFPR